MITKTESHSSQVDLAEGARARWWHTVGEKYAHLYLEPRNFTAPAIRVWKKDIQKFISLLTELEKDL